VLIIQIYFVLFINNFPFDVFLFKSYSGSNLRRIRLTECQYISYNQFSEVANKFPLLEELDISFSNLSENSLEVIGRCCPLLKSLKFSRTFYTYIEGDEDAFAIAKTMPELRHLSMIGNILTNDGLLAILDGCHFLEFLDLSNCFHLDLSGSLGEKCRDLIKDLVLPTYIDENCDDEDTDSFYLDSLNEN
jgi:F-box/leucine-rich repeat protein 2/20